VLLFIASIGAVAQAPAGKPNFRTNFEAAPTVLKLWPDGAPGALGATPNDMPTLTVWRPTPVDKARATRTAIIVAPGGGYVNLADNHEGRQVANWLNAMGVTAFVLEYRLAPRYGVLLALQDMQRAIRIVRSRAAEFGIKPDRLGVMGFSAGGHLCSLAGTRFDNGDPAATDAIDKLGSRPDFMILGYPVISFTAMLANNKTRGISGNVFPGNPDPAKAAAEISTDLLVTTNTPPTFLFSTSADTLIPAEQHAVPFYLALRKAHVDAELHVFEKGPHGVGLDLGDPVLSEWTVALRNWMSQHGWLSAP
jgi:acetyl esterase/lipase